MVSMPLGDPMGGETPETDKGKLMRIATTSVPVSDLEEARSFYTQVIGLEVLSEDQRTKRLELGHEGSECRIVLYVPSEREKRQPGGFTGITFATDSLYDLHKTLMDESVRFTRKPLRDEKGRLAARFTDLDGNEYEVIDQPK
jgi:catechol-2,3-dioxygenase